jgi:predicted DNA-binding transcriptional regulator AlpA
MRVLRKPAVRDKTGLSQRVIDGKERVGDFPQRFLIGSGRSVGWLEDEIDAWIIKQAGKRRRGRRGIRLGPRQPEATEAT